MISSELHAWFQGVPWQYRAAGRGPRGLLVLGDPRVHVARTFEPTRRVLMPRLPPTGSVREVLDGLLELVAHEGLGRVDVYGDGVGAAIAHAFIRLHPERVDRLALSGFGVHSSVHALRVRARAAWAKWLPGSAERASAAHELALLAELLRNRAAYRVDVPVERPGRVLIALPSGEGGFNRREVQALIDGYPGAITTYSGNGKLERKLELFFRVEPTLRALPPVAKRA